MSEAEREIGWLKDRVSALEERIDRLVSNGEGLINAIWRLEHQVDQLLEAK